MGGVDWIIDPKFNKVYLYYDQHLISEGKQNPIKGWRNVTSWQEGQHQLYQIFKTLDIKPDYCWCSIRGGEFHAYFEVSDTLYLQHYADLNCY